MRHALSFALLLTSVVALAQAPVEPAPAAPAAAPAAVVASAEAAAPETLWVAEDATSVRFFGERTAGPEFRKGTKVTVLARDGGQVRVFTGDRYGWVDAAKLQVAAPGDAPLGLELGGVTP